MGNNTFSSPGAAAISQLRDFMYEREVAKRQQMLDGLMIEDRQRQRAREDMERQRQAKIDAQAEADRALDKADRAARIFGPDVDLDSQTAATLRGGGYRVDDRQTLPARTLNMPAGDGGPMVESRELSSTNYSRRGETYAEKLDRERREAAQAERNEARRFRDEQADADRAFRGEQAQANRDAAKERAEAERDMKLLIADMARSGSAETRALANELKRLQIAAAADKLETAKSGRDKSASEAKQTTQTALDHVNRLLDPKDIGAGIGAATGAYELRGFTQGAQDFNAVREQLVAALTQPNLGALKGPMSDKDVAFVKSLATRLDNRRMSEAETRKALTEAQTFLRSKIGDSGNARGNGPAVGTRRTINGVPAQWDGEGWLPVGSGR